jgi:hypothetical protein
MLPRHTPEKMLCAPDLESRQSTLTTEENLIFDALRPGFGIKAKQKTRF